jgi:hypothetical protein
MWIRLGGVGGLCVCSILVTLTGYNADDVEMLAKKSVPSGINDQKYYRWRLEFYRFFSLELV